MKKKLRRLAVISTCVVAAVVALVVAGSVPTQLNFVGTATIFGFTLHDKSWLLRQANCSITQYSFYPTRILTPATNYQDTLHQLAGLTTTPDVFAKGCKDPVLGVASTAGAYLGQTPSGMYLGVQGATDHNTNLVVYGASLASLNYTSTTLAQNVSPQVLGVDLNHDGTIDVIASGVTDPVTNNTGIGVFLSNGDGTFKPGSYYDINIASDQAFIIDDLNGDGIPDILVPHTDGSGNPQLTALLGKGDGTFTVGPSTASAVASSFTPSRPIQTGDFNGDGKVDVLTADGMLYLGNGDGSFGSGTQALPSGYAYFTAAFAVGDFNGDGHLDVAELLDETFSGLDAPPPENQGAVIIYYGHGNGTFTQGPAYDAVPAAAALVATDLDGDGNLDLLVARSSNGVFGVADHARHTWLYQVLMGHGDGTFNGAPLTIVNSFIASQQFPSQRWYATADFNGDGLPDLLTSSTNVNGGSPGTGVIVSLGVGDGSFGTPILSTMSFAPTIVAAGDLNGDGKSDAVAVGTGAGGAATVAVLFGHGAGTLNGEADYLLPDTDDIPGRAVIGDFNGDGNPDIAVAMYTATPCTSPCAPGVYVLYGSGGGAFQPAVRVDTSTQPLLATADLNKDGRADLVVADVGNINDNPPVAGVLHVYLGQTNGSFISITPTIPMLFFSDLTIGDLNKDGNPDIVAAAYDAGRNNQMDVLLGQGNGTFGAAITTVISGGQADPAPVITIADFDGDGNPDVAYFLPGAFSGILFGAGDGTLPTQLNMTILTPVFPAAPMAVDLNDDKRPDLLFADGEAVPGLIGLVNGGSFSTAASGFSVAVGPTAGTITAGQSAITTVTLTPSGGFTGSVSLSCSGLPAAAACSFSPAPVSTNGSAATSALTITTTARTAMNSGSTPSNPLVPGGLLLAAFGVPMIWRRRRDIVRLSYHAPPMLLLISALAMPGCGGSSGSSASSVSSSSGSSTSSGGSSSSSSGGSSSSSSSGSSSSSSSGSSTSSSSSSGGSSSSSSSGSSSGGGSTGTPAGTYTVTITATSGSTTQTTTYTLTVN